MGFMLPPFFSAIGNFIVTHWAKIKTAAYLLTLAVGVKEVAFDRSGFKYHGCVKALADAAREAGLKF